ncbi:antibiotic biosynthesis monooxygenase [Streptomyces sp. ISL-98]|uniref:putative quinol monooxygenase n=1 Tax=Streptomyces sp. ISL-98 TaxID=2819192 RepID=UPI001BE72C4C|nr:antibiotic biosynthesis monooxygenase family protein [Streptomyces sp. ISL-98]MBT2510958.1 antibiotic biosynthesis monooxygenase [Streptomyces sp. ISL-98]
MADESKYWASGSWQVSEGSADRFVERWTEFLTWTGEEHKGLVAARLIRDQGNPSHFVSFAKWADAESRTAWQNDPQFAEYFGACRELCTDVQASGYELAVAI